MWVFQNIYLFSFQGIIHCNFKDTYLYCGAILHLFRMFSSDEIDEIRRIKMWDIIVNASSVAPEEIQRNVFFHLAEDVCPQPTQLNASNMDPCPYLQGFDYFRVSTVICKY